MFTSVQNFNSGFTKYSPYIKESNYNFGQENDNDNIEAKVGLLLTSLAGLGCITLALIKAKQKNKIKELYPLKDMKLVLTDPWVDDYIKLCKKHGKRIRTTDGTAGDWQHYQELLLKDTNPEKYKRYLADRKIKAKTDETARLLEELDKMS